jgi:hypothetical protein
VVTSSGRPPGVDGAEEYFAGQPTALAVLRAVLDVVEGLGGCELRTSKSQVALRRRRGFAYLWCPGLYLRRRTAEIVLSVVLDRHDHSPRWKEVAHASPATWTHHLEVRDAAEIDGQVAGWLREACERSA